MSVAQPVIDYIDPATRRIYLLDGVTEYHPIDDIYAEVRYLRRTDETLRKYFMFVQGGGNIPKNVSGTLRTPRYSIFKNCKVVVSEDTYVTGEQLYADADENIIGKGPDCIDHVLSPEDAYLDYEPPGSEVIISGSGVTTQDKADIVEGVWSAEISDDGSEDNIGELVHAIWKLTGNEVEKEGNIITVYKDDGETVWRKYDITSGRTRIEV